MKLTNEQNIGLKEIRAIQENMLQTLKVIDSVCREHGLKYVLAYGSLIGAVREGGFIPWDDDADIMMPRHDYEIFAEHAHEWLPDKYEWVSGREHPRYPYPFARIQDRETTYILRRPFKFIGGIPIDIFPLDGATSDKKQWKKHCKRYHLMCKLLEFNQYDSFIAGSWWKVPVYLLCKWLIPSKWMHSIINEKQKEYDGEDLWVSHTDLDFLYSKFLFENISDIKYEDTVLMIPKEYDKVLRPMFNDYMKRPTTYPPLNFRLIDLDTPYREYKSAHPELSDWSI